MPCPYKFNSTWRGPYEFSSTCRDPYEFSSTCRGPYHSSCSATRALHPGRSRSRRVRVADPSCPCWGSLAERRCDPPAAWTCWIQGMSRRFLPSRTLARPASRRRSVVGESARCGCIRHRSYLPAPACRSCRAWPTRPSCSTPTLYRRTCPKSTVASSAGVGAGAIGCSETVIEHNDLTT